MYLLGFVSSAPERGEDAISPVIGGHIQPSKHLRCSNSLGVHAHLLMGCTTVCHGLHQCVNAACFSSSRWAQGHHAMAHTLCLIQLNQLQHPWGMVDQSCLSHLQQAFNAQTLQGLAYFLNLKEGALYVSLKRFTCHVEEYFNQRFCEHNKEIGQLKFQINVLTWVKFYHL